MFSTSTLYLGSFVIPLAFVLHTLPLNICRHSVVLCNTAAQRRVSSVKCRDPYPAPTKKKNKSDSAISANQHCPCGSLQPDGCAEPLRSRGWFAECQHKCTAHPAVSTLLGSEGNRATMISVSKRWTASKAVLAAAWALVAAVAGVPTVDAMFSSSSDVVQASKRDDEESGS